MLLRSYVSENHVVGSGFSDGSRLETRDISGSCWLTSWESSPLQSLSSLLCDVTASARSWTSSDGWFQGERPADRRALEGAVAKAGRVSFKRGSRERRSARRCVVLNCPVCTSPTGGWSNQSVGMGRSPAHVQAFCPHYTL